MPTPTYTPLANITLGSAASSIVFGSIPATYSDLVIIFTGTGSTTLQGRIRLNADTTANYDYTRVSGSGTSATSTSQGSQTLGFISAIARATTTDALQMNINIIDYSATGKPKTLVSRADQAANGTEAFVNRWFNNSAITSVTILTSTGNWAIGTTAALYGIAS